MGLHALPPRPPALSDRAHADLRYIRTTLESSGRFTCVSGPGMVLVGIVGLLAAALTWALRAADAWIYVWPAAAAMGVTVGGVAMLRKARREERQLLNAQGRRFFLSFLPPVAAGAVLTPVLYLADQGPLLPGTWLLLYGAAVTAGGAVSIRILPVTGGVFMLLGVLALFLPPFWSTPLLCAGFAGLHVAAGIVIWRSHGG